LVIRKEHVALGIFALLVVFGPLTFGAVDRLTQVGLLVLLTIGVALQPPVVARPSARANTLIVASVAILVLKEFAPSAWFGSTEWHRTLSQNFGVVFPWTHNPEPARALDALLAGVVAFVWFFWVRTLALNRQHRPLLVWSMFASTAITAAVSFATRDLDPYAIFGLRYTPGWVGFGPFPNRNHSACFLAMGLVLGAGCVAWAGVRRKFPIMAGGIVLIGLVLAAMLATQSRGGVVVAAVGLAIFFGLALIKFRTQRALGIALGVSLILASVALAFGAQVIARFSSKEGGEVSTVLRLRIWEDTFRMWKDAPVFGHGLQSFTQLFPIYQQVDAGSMIVVHPESSWLQWLVELGALPVLGGLVALVIFVIPRVRELFSANRTIFLRAGAFGAAAILIVHSLFDVPGHRWGTAGFALAALAVACAPTERERFLLPNRRSALVPAVIAAFWLLPILWEIPAWSPTSLNRLLARDYMTPNVTTAELQRAVGYFPLNPTLHQAIGMHELASLEGARSRDWQKHFRIAMRLAPGAWEAAADQARACINVSPRLALHYWQIAIEGAGHRASEVFGMALNETVRLPGATEAWFQYAESHPSLLLTYAIFAPEKAGRAAFDHWWKQRGAVAGDLSDGEIEGFYNLVARWGDPEQLTLFQQQHPELKARDFKKWAGLLHQWKKDGEAWQLIASQVPEPNFTSIPARSDLDRLQAGWDQDDRQFVNTRDFAAVLTAIGNLDQARDVIVYTARFSGALDWFVRKGAHLLAEQGDFENAVALYLGLLKPTVKPTVKRTVPKPP
jgi:O-antigen ligase